MLLTDGLEWAKDRVEFWEYKVIVSWGIWLAFDVWWLTAKRHSSFFPLYLTSGLTDKNAWIFFFFFFFCCWVGIQIRLCLHTEVSLWLHRLNTIRTWSQPPLLTLSSHFGSFRGDCLVFSRHLNYLSNSSFHTHLVCVLGWGVVISVDH